jgi:hypothetical protein
LGWTFVAALSLACGSTTEPASDEAGEEAGSVETSADASSTGDGGEGEGESTGEPEEDARVVELRVKEFNIPVTETYYACFEFTFDIDKLAHIVGFEAKVDNAAHVHHYVLTMLDQPSGKSAGYSCFESPEDFVWAWAPGQDEFWMPPEAGFLIGDRPGGRVTLRLQVHYNNPLNTTGQIDSSGVDLHVTDKLRANHAGALVFGDVAGISIPPGEPAHEHIMRCKSSATSKFMEGPIQVFGTSMHAHEIGSVLWSELWRDGQRVQEINRDDPYLFDSQHMKFVDLEIRPGDEIVNHCIYDSTERTSTTIGGPGTRDEMCWNTVVYYPKIQSGFSYCTSGH